MSTITVTQPRVKHSSEVRNAGVSFSGCLDDGETLTGTPTVTATGVTISGAAVTGAVVNIEGVDVPIGEAVTFVVTGGTAGTDYTITISCATTESQTIVRKVILKVSDS